MINDGFETTRNGSTRRENSFLRPTSVSAVDWYFGFDRHAGDSARSDRAVEIVRLPGSDRSYSDIKSWKEILGVVVKVALYITVMSYTSWYIFLEPRF